MSGPIISMTKDLIPPKVVTKDGVVQIGDNLYTMARPENAVRWIVRAGEKVLQQCWTVTGGDKGWTCVHQEWRDVPVETE